MNNTILYYRIVIFRVLCGVLIVGISTFVAGISSTAWSAMTTDARMLTILMVALAMLKFLEGFFDKSVANLSSGKPMLNGNAPQPEAPPPPAPPKP